MMRYEEYKHKNVIWRLDFEDDELIGTESESINGNDTLSQTDHDAEGRFRSDAFCDEQEWHKFAEMLQKTEKMTALGNYDPYTREEF